ncbi:heat shock protein 70 family protein, partial [Kipferlia bialata]
LVPNCASFTPQERLFGASAFAQKVSNLSGCVHHIVRLIGRDFDNETTQKEIKQLPFKCAKMENGRV